jgi:hypothetical protein
MKNWKRKKHNKNKKVREMLKRNKEHKDNYEKT